MDLGRGILECQRDYARWLWGLSFLISKEHRAISAHRARPAFPCRHTDRAENGAFAFIYFSFFSGGYFLSSFCMAFARFFSRFSGLALGSIVLLATPRQTRSWFLASYISRASWPV